MTRQCIDCVFGLECDSVLTCNMWYILARNMWCICKNTKKVVGGEGGEGRDPAPKNVDALMPAAMSRY